MVSEARQPYFVPDDDAEPPSWNEVARRRRLRIRLLAAIAVVAVVAVGAAAMVASAATHYERGRQAMAARRFGVAVEEFAAARVLTFSYRDSAALADRAQAQLDAEAARTDLQRQQRAALASLLRRASDRLQAKDVDGVIATLREARVLVPEGPLAGTTGQVAMAGQLAKSLSKAGAAALRNGRWELARSHATALLILDPSSADGARITARSKKGAGLQDDLAAARTAARKGEWREALRLAQAVLREWPGYPGAAAVVTAARTALKPKPRPTATVAPVETSAPAPQPPPPPAPEPPAPPPP